MKFLITDAFADTLFGGNPAGVVLLPKGSPFPSDNTMLKTAAELRYSETAFVSAIGDKEFQIRYFTPAAEVELCGHATIGSFCALLHLGLIKSGDKCMNHTLSGDIEVEVGDGYVMMDMAKPELISTISSEKYLRELYEIMGTEYKEIKFGDKVLLPELISTGLPDIIMPVTNSNVLNALAPDMKALSALSERYNVTGVHAFAPESGGAVTARTRNFAPLYDIDEEAATGTSSGALTYYLYRNDFIGDGAEVNYIQGEAMGRPSKIKSTLNIEGDRCGIKVGGNAVVLAEGDIHI